MSRQEDRARKAAEWLEHLEGWKDSGQSLSAYAKANGLALWAMYHWRSVLTREGRWLGSGAVRRRTRARDGGSPVPLRFSRVTIRDPRQCVPLIVRVVLGNGRRVEIELGEPASLSEVLGLLERPA